MRRPYRHEDTYIRQGNDDSPTQKAFADPLQEGDDKHDDEDAGKDSGIGGYFVHGAPRPDVQPRDEFSQRSVNQPLKFSGAGARHLSKRWRRTGFIASRPSARRSARRGPGFGAPE